MQSAAVFLLICKALLSACAGTPVRVKSRQLPLYWFDVVFRTTGTMLLFGLWAVRACAAHFLPRHFDLRVNLVWVPAAIYAGQALIRGIIYQLHVAGARCNSTAPDLCRLQFKRRMPCLHLQPFL
jgi:hypothetical protein